MNAFREAFPILYVDDVEQAAAFYASAFGFEETYRHEEDGVADFAFLALDPLGIGIGKRPDDDVDDAAERLRAAGAAEVLAPTDQAWDERMCTFVDPSGHLIHVGAKAR